MKLFELTWDITCGEFGFLESIVRVFKNLEEAYKYGQQEEYEFNTGKRFKGKKLTENILQKTRESAALEGRFYEFNGANELTHVGGPKGLYKVNLGRKV